MYIFKYWICFESIEKQEVYKKKKKNVNMEVKKREQKRKTFLNKVAILLFHCLFTTLFYLAVVLLWGWFFA